MKKGFTLIEMLAVMIILSVLLILSLTPLSRIIKVGNKKITTAQDVVIRDALKDFSNDNNSKNKVAYYNCTTLKNLVDEGYIEKKLLNGVSLNQSISFIIKDDKLTYEFNSDKCEDADFEYSFELIGKDEETIEIGNTYSDKGFKALIYGYDVSDDVDIKYFDQNHNEINSINTNVNAIYFIEYKLAIDEDNEKYDTLERMIKIVNSDKPRITHPGDTKLYDNVNTYDVLNGVKAVDKNNKDLDVIAKTNLSLGIIGIYTVTYTATDDFGNTISLNRKITIKKTITNLVEAIKDNYDIINDPKTKPAAEINLSTEADLVRDYDDDGPTLYFRGNIKDNYIQLGVHPQDIYVKKYDNDYLAYSSSSCTECTKIEKGTPMIFRIVRINGDGTIRIILEPSIAEIIYAASYSENKYIGFTYDKTTSEKNSNIKTTLDNWYNSVLANNFGIENVLTTSKFCNDTSIAIDGIKYGAYYRISETKTPSFKCPSNQNPDYGGLYNLKIGLLTADELVFSGLSKDISNTNNFLFDGNRAFYNWTMSPTNSTMEFTGGSSIDYWTIAINSNPVRPVLNLKANTKIISGNGKKETPFIIKIN